MAGPLGTGRSGRGWRVPGLAAGQPSRRVNSNQIQVFSAKGRAAKATMGTFPLSQIGFLIPGTSYVYVRPRLTQNEGFSGGGGSQGSPISGSVLLTNPGYSTGFRRFQRTRSIGMGAAGQEGRVMDVTFRPALGYFSVA